MNKTTKWYARPLYAVVALALVAGLMMVPAVVPMTPAVGPSIVQAAATGVNIISPNTTSPICVGPNGTFTVSGNVTADAAGTGRITFYLNETEVKTEDITFINGTTPWLVSIELSNQPEGNYTLNATAKQPPVTGTPTNATQSGAVKVDATPPVGVNIIAPNATSVWKAGSSHNISWNNTTIVDNMSGLKTNPISLEWSNDNGGTWDTLTSGTLNNGTYPWTVNATASEECLVKITATDNATNTASSTTDTFTIFTLDTTLPSITLNAPTANENITGTYTLNATASDGESGVASVIFAYRPTGGAWIEIGTNSTPVGNNFTYNWTTTAVSEGKVDVKATATNGVGATNSTTNANVTIDNTAPTGVAITEPLDGAFVKGNTVALNVSASDAFSGVENVTFYNCTAGNWSAIAYGTLASGNISSGHWNATWDTSAINITGYLIKAQVKDWVGKTTNSSVINITVDNTLPSVNLTSPIGNETWKVNTSHNITWNSTLITDNFALKDNPIKLEYSFNGGSTWSTIISATANDGSHSWLVPGPVSNTTKVKITAEDKAGNTNSTTSANFTMYAISDATLPTVTLTYPLDNDYLTGTVNVTANASDLESGIKIVYFYNCTAGGSENLISSDNSTPYQISWNTTPAADNTTYEVWAIATNGVGVNATSAKSTGITVDNTLPTVNVTSPVSGWIGGTTNITANATASVSNISSVVFRYSTDAGGNWSSIGNGSLISGNYTIGNWSVTWDASGIPTATNVTLNATATNGVGLTAFNVTGNVTVDNIPPTVPSATLTYPNGGEKLAGTQGSTITITWNNATISDTPSGLPANPIALDYSTDNGGNWSTITNATANNATYNWTLTSAITSSQCLVKITATDNATLTANDTSNSTFTLGPVSTISIKTGWNFISVPKRLASGHDTFGDLLYGIDWSRGYGYNATTGQWVTLTSSTTVEVLDGYWIDSNEQATITLTYLSGGQTVPPTKDLTGKAWNAIGFSRTSAMAANATMMSVDASWSTLIGWNATSQSYEDSIIHNVNDDQTMTPGKGYWVWMTANDTLSAVSA